MIKTHWAEKDFGGKSGLEIGKMLSSSGVNDFAQTIPAAHLKQIDYTALVAYPAQEGPFLCELQGPVGFQPEIKETDGLWFTSAGSGQQITDPFLALLRSVFWMDGPPNVQGGIFTALWALRHACDLNPGGIKDPINIAVLAREKGKLVAKMLTDAELLEHGNMVDEATKHMAGFREVLLGEAGASAVPKPEG